MDIRREMSRVRGAMILVLLVATAGGAAWAAEDEEKSKPKRQPVSATVTPQRAMVSQKALGEQAPMSAVLFTPGTGPTTVDGDFCEDPDGKFDDCMNKTCQTGEPGNQGCKAGCALILIIRKIWCDGKMPGPSIVFPSEDSDCQVLATSEEKRSALSRLGRDARPAMSRGADTLCLARVDSRGRVHEVGGEVVALMSDLSWCLREAGGSMTGCAPIDPRPELADVECDVIDGDTICTCDNLMSCFDMISVCSEPMVCDPDFICSCMAGDAAAGPAGRLAN